MTLKTKAVSSKKGTWRNLILGLIILILTQSCAVYNKTTSIKHASEKNSKVKLTTYSGQKLRYKSIHEENGLYYGIQKVQGKHINFLIDESTIESIRVKNKGASIFLNILGAGLLIALIPAIAFAAGGGVI